jgi:multidrug efflux pump subunit AcrB
MKEFKPSSWSINNKTSIYVLLFIITIWGILAYMGKPKEQYPEIVFPQMYVSTVYPGTAPTDMENLVTKPLEKQMKSISGVKKIVSNSFQDYSSVLVEFNTDVDVAVAKQKVKDAVDKAKNDLPKDMDEDPQVIEVDVSQIPIMNINLSGNYDLNKLKKYAEDLQDRIESLKEITRVDLAGDLEREIQINVDKFKMEAAKVTLMDIERAVSGENLTVTGGQISMNGQKRNVSIKGEFKDPLIIENLIIRSGSGAEVYLKDIAEVKDYHKEKETFARLDGQNVITLNVIKRSGENLIDASDKIQALIEDMQETKFPRDLKVTITGDQSKNTRITLHDLNNTIIIGFILVTIILMFFMGTTNAIFVGLSVPLSMFISFAIGFPLVEGLSGRDITVNMIVQFGILLALGIVVDDAIVVIENTHRIFDNGKKSIKEAAKEATGEVFLPVLSGTLTTLAPFFPLLFWPGVMGNFMWFLPITLIILLFSSLISAYIFNPVFAVDTMKVHDHDESKKVTQGFKITSVVFVALAILFYSIGWFGMGNFTVTAFALYVLNKFVFSGWIKFFQERLWPGIQNRYANVLTWCLKGWRPVGLMLSTFLLLVFSIMFIGKMIELKKVGVEFFPSSDPNFVYAYIEMPIGTDQLVTDSITQIVEKKVMGALGSNNPLVESVIANVGKNAGDPSQPDFSSTPHKGRVSVAFVEFAKRNGKSTREYLDKIRDVVKGIPAATIIVDQEKHGPPTGKPINIEIAGDDYTELIATSEELVRFINEQGIQGIEELKSDVLKHKPEIVVDIDRDKASREGISTGQMAMEIRTALFGKEVSKFREDNDEYDITLRFQEDQRDDLDALMNLKITYRDMNMGGQLRSVPLSALATVRYEDTYGGIKRKNQKRLVTVASNVLSGYTANEVVSEIKKALPDFHAPQDVTIAMTGEQEDQKETSDFLGMAMLASIMIILLILVTQFNSVSKPVIIISEIVFSLIGVFLGFGVFQMNFSVVMTGIGIVALAGIVVRNGILLVEFTELLEKAGVSTYEAVIEAGRIRMTPVLMTASATILGLIPLAVGLNIDFVTLFTEFDPKIFFGGDNVAFWGPLSWTMIFGLGFATLLTLFLVPVMYLLVHKLKVKLNMVKEVQEGEKIPELERHNLV